METKFFSYCTIAMDENQNIHYHYFIVGAPTKDDACDFFSKEFDERLDPWFISQVTLEEIERYEAYDEEYVTWI